MLKSEKVILRGIAEQDLNDILMLREDFIRNRMLARYPFPFNEVSEREWLKNLYTKGFPTRIDFGVYNFENHFVGIINARNIDYIHKRCEYGIIINDQNSRKGYAFEATLLFVKYLFFEINMERIYLEVLEENIRAIKLYEKVGFLKEGYFKKHVYQEGKRKNVIYMALLKDEFESR